MRTTTALLILATLSVGGCPADSADDQDAGRVTVSPGFQNAARTGLVTGATEFNATCQGYFPSVAQHRLTIDEPLSMRIEVIGSPNAVVRVAATGVGTFCGAAGSPISRFWNRATLDVFVGSTTQSESFSYELRLVAN